MNSRSVFLTPFPLLLSMILAGVGSVGAAPISAFTYQGRLADSGTPANGSYDLRFALFDAASGGNQFGNALTNAPVAVSGGVFTVTLNFGAGAFPGADRWLQIGVRTNGGAIAFTPLNPRQALTATPYALTAGDVAAGANIARLDAPNTAVPATGVPVVSFGFVVNATVTGGGSGYLTPPVVTMNDATGFGAVILAAVLNGTVTGLTVQNPGTGYSAGATLTIGTPPSNAFQTFPGVNYFTGVNALNNPNNTFAGSFSGNGAGLTNFPFTPFTWHVVSGTTQQAQPNNGYLLTNDALVTITLPAFPTPGDVVKVSGTGAGGWKLAKNPGQSVRAQNLTNNTDITWTPRDTNRNWWGVASSSDGSKLVAVVNGGQIYTSTDFGVTWTPRDAIRNWDGVASSADGGKLVALLNGGQIYTSTDFGVTWVPHASNRGWVGIASSSDGGKLVAIEEGGQIYTSTDSGVSWTPREGNRSWQSVASSADGSKLVAAVYGGQIYTSTDSGISWTPRDISRNWIDVASSSDGSKLVTAVPGGQIYTSTNSGASWTPHGVSQVWFKLASSSDGNKLVAVALGGQIYTSTDSGAGWTPHESNRNWRGVACSSDGSRIATVVQNGQIYTAGTGGFLLGDPYAAIELQYIGGGQFIPLSHEGTIISY